MALAMRTVGVPHPGVVLVASLQKMDVNSFTLSKYIGVPPGRLSQIINGKRSITANTALKLASFFADTTAEYWMNLQRDYDLSQEKRRISA